MTLVVRGVDLLPYPPVSPEVARSLVTFLNTRPCPVCRDDDQLAIWPSGASARPTKRNVLPPSSPRPPPLDLRRLRSDLIDLMEARIDRKPPDPSSLRRGNARLRRAVGIPQLAWTPRRTNASPNRRTYPRSRRPSEIEVAEWLLALGDPRLPFRRCAAEGCHHFLYAERPHRRWCSPHGCGNRVRVARHHLRRRGIAGSTGS
jgi:predicted RNA-binding Zn ribbon-like protein